MQTPSTSAPTEINLETLCAWSAPRRIQTKHGPRLLRKAPTDEAFWAVWRSGKDQLKAAGIGVGKNDCGEWEVSWWLPLDPAVLAKERAIAEASRATDAQIEIPCPEGLAYLGYQKAGIAFARRAFTEGKRGILLGDEMGLGKTIQAIGIINADPAINRVLVVCPASLKLNWKRELAKWLTRPLRVAVQSSASGWVGPMADVVIVNYDILKKFDADLRAGGWDLLVADECHFVKNPKAQRTRALLGQGKTVPPMPAQRRVYMTGTPICNRPKEIFGLIASLDPETWPSFFTFGKRYCDGKHNGYGWDFDGASNLDELQEQLRSTVLVRRLKQDVLIELPAKRRQVIELPAEGKVAALVANQVEEADRAEERLIEARHRVEMAKLADDLDGYAAAVEELKAGEQAAFEEAARIAKEVALAKVPFVVAHVRDAIAEENEKGGFKKVIVFAHHHEVIDALKAAFGGVAVTLDGRVKLEERQAAVDRFQADPTCLVFIGGIHAAGVGITLTASSHVVFAEIDWVPGNMCQAEDRAHRIGQRDSVLAQMLVLEGSLDAHKIRTLIRKMDVIESALDAHHAPRQVETGTPTTTIKVDLSARASARKRDAAEPMPLGRADRATVSWEELEAQAALLTADQIAAIHQGLQMLAGVCDGAREIDGCGFNKFDTRTGKALANAPRITARQALLGQKLVRKYRGQLPTALVEAAGAAKKTN